MVSDTLRSVGRRFGALGFALGAAGIVACSDSTAPVWHGPVDPVPESPDLSTLPVGGVRTLSIPSGGENLTVSAEEAGAEFLIAVSNSSLAFFDSATYAVTTENRIIPTTQADGNRSLEETGFQFENAIRSAEREAVSSYLKRARQRENAPVSRASTGDASTSLNPVPANAIVAPRINDRVNVKVGVTCSSYANTVGTVVAVGRRSIIVVDEQAPSGGFTSQDFAEIAAEFDELVFPVSADYFGVPTDVDSNGRVIIYYTPQVNRMTAAGQKVSSGYVGGYFFGVDLFVDGTCTKSNGAEIFYLLTPDPAAIHGNTFSRAEVREVTRGTIAHEFQHMISFGRRVIDQGVMWEAAWLDEGLSHLAEDLVGRRKASKGPFTRIGTADLPSAAIPVADYNAFFFQNLARLNRFVGSSAEFNIIDTAVTLEVRGAAWGLVRYTMDWYAGANPQHFTRRLIEGPENGPANLMARAGVPFQTLLRDFYLTLYADGFDIPLIADRYHYRSYEMHALQRKVSTSDILARLGTALNPIVIPQSGANLGTTLQPTAVRYFRSNATNGLAREIEIQQLSGDGWLSSAGRIHVLRLR